jgi:hypothetical protein
MTIRAFVGHSFLPEDQVVVRAFTDYLDTLKDALPSFMWEHAERAEPGTLTDKVLRIAAGKNLFIGICTAKESAIPTNSLSNFWPFKNYKTAKTDEFTLKASDWVIQEIGMAIGMGMKTILLHEKGIRLPGGLQGNTEYIEFDRGSPSEAFPKLLQMVSSMTPKESTALVVVSAETEVSVRPEDAPNGTATLDSVAPDETWDREMYQFAAVWSARRKDEAAFDKIDTAYRKTSFASHYDDGKAWDAHLESVRVRFNFEGDLDRLVALASENPKNSRVRAALAATYAFYSEHASAAAEYVAACDHALSEPDGAKLIEKLQWADSDCVLLYSATAASVSFVGSFERSRLPLAGLLAGFGNPLSLGVAPAQAEKITHHIRYEGRFEGHVFFGKVVRRTDGQSLLADASSEVEVMMVLSSDLMIMKVLESPQANEPKFYELNRLVSPG